MRVDPHHNQIGLDLSKHASERVSEIVLDTIGLCNTPEQAIMVSVHVLGTVASLAAGATAHREDVDFTGMTAPQILRRISEWMEKGE